MPTHNAVFRHASVLRLKYGDFVLNPGVSGLTVVFFAADDEVH